MLQQFKDWWSKPFDAGMDVPHWALFFLLIVVISIFWGRVLNVLAETTGV